MTGLSGAGKSTLAFALKESLAEQNLAAEVIDGDVYRKTLCKDLGFTAADRKENIRRLARVAENHAKKGIIAVIAAINPFEEIRAELRERLGAKEIWIRCDIAVLVQRDTKGLYKKALLPDGHPEKIGNLTGINDPYETPSSPDLIIDTDAASIEDSKKQLLNYVFNLVKAGSC